MTVKFMEHARRTTTFIPAIRSPATPRSVLGPTYGLGTANCEPARLHRPRQRRFRHGIVYGSGFLPAVHQGSFLYPDAPSR